MENAFSQIFPDCKPPVFVDLRNRCSPSYTVPLMRAPLFLIIGAIIGAAGALLYQQSTPPVPGSPEARNSELERELIKTRVALAAAEARAPKPGLTTKEKLANGARTIVDDLKAGRTVDMNDVFRAAKPVISDFSPLFERIQRRDMRRHNEYILGDLTRKYHLNASQQESLRTWLNNKTEEQIAAMRQFHQRDDATLEDMMKSGRKFRSDDGLDGFMETVLTGDELGSFKTERLNQRVERVQTEAEQQVSRLNSMVQLDEKQQDQVFSLMARSSPDFDPGMKFEGLGDDTTQLAAGQSRDDAIMEVLRPDQRAQYEHERQVRRETAQKEMSDFGLKVPDNWDMFGDN
ncbi:MAG: hypothetical protein JWM59_4859 [Verrucomicrobiales bacterium]|nr:hypothetical protein [Verrucomicrobiales bacterium]